MPHAHARSHARDRINACSGGAGVVQAELIDDPDDEGRSTAMRVELATDINQAMKGYIAYHASEKLKTYICHGLSRQLCSGRASSHGQVYFWNV